MAVRKEYTIIKWSYYHQSTKLEVLTEFKKILRDKSLILNWIMKYLKIIHKDLISPWSFRRGMVLIQNSQPVENLYKKIPKFNI